MAFCLPLAAVGATKKPIQKKTTAGKAVVTHGKVAVGAHGKASVHRKGTAGKNVHGGVKTAPVQRSQAAPTSDRYREIQQALVDKGYLKAEPTGVWDADTQDAMRRFQADQKLDQTGKINSLSLISLGLGPKHGQ